MKVFLDANILFSAARVESPLRAMLLTLVHRSACVTNPHAVAEAERNVILKQPEHADSFRQLMSHIPIENRFRDPVDIALADKDKPILGGAIGCQCTHLHSRSDNGELTGLSVSIIFSP